MKRKNVTSDESEDDDDDENFSDGSEKSSENNARNLKTKAANIAAIPIKTTPQKCVESKASTSIPLPAVHSKQTRQNVKNQQLLVFLFFRNNDF